MYSYSFFIIMTCDGLLFIIRNSQNLRFTFNLQTMCDQYWPDSGTKKYGKLDVTILKVERFSDYLVRTFSIKKVNTYYVKIDLRLYTKISISRSMEFQEIRLQKRENGHVKLYLMKWMKKIPQYLYCFLIK